MRERPTFREACGIARVTLSIAVAMFATISALAYGLSR